MHINLTNTLGYVTRIVVLIPIVLLLANRKKNQGRGLWVIFFYLCYSILTEIVNTYYNEVRGEVSYFNFNLFTIVEYCLLTYFIQRILRSKGLRKVILGISVIFLGLAIYDLFRTAGRDNYDSLTSGLEAILLIVYCIFYLFEQITKPDHIFFYAIPEFWVIVAILLYFSGTFFLATYAQTLLRNNDEASKFQYAVINLAFEVVKSVLLGVAMVVKGPDKKTNLSKIDFSSLDEHLNLNR